MGLEDKVVVVTGAARGIGFATVELAARLGARPVLCDLEPSAVGRAVDQLAESGVNALGLVGDVSSPGDVRANADEVMDKCGRVDVLVNNAGTHTTTPARDLTEKHWRREVDVCMTGSFLWAQAVAVRSMIPNRTGSIVNLGSGASLAALPNSASYVSAKHGLVGLTRALAVDWAQYNIRVNCVCPGFTWTDLSRSVMEANPDVMRQRIDRIPLGAGAQPEDIARAIIFLASDERAGAISGVALPVDGGTAALLSGYSAPHDK